MNNFLVNRISVVIVKRVSVMSTCKQNINIDSVISIVQYLDMNFLVNGYVEVIIKRVSMRSIYK